MVSHRTRRRPERITDVNDGIVAVAGMGLGLAGAEVSAATSYMVISVSTLVGAMSVFGKSMLIHEFFHDGRHLLGFPCH